MIERWISSDVKQTGDIGKDSIVQNSFSEITKRSKVNSWSAGRAYGSKVDVSII